jgi:EcsC protein family
MELSDTDRQALRVAVRRLEAPGFVGRLTNLIGRPAEMAARALPKPASGLVARAAQAALARALDIALFSLRDKRLGGGRVVHSALASASGAVGGAFGLPALAVELPISTAIMLRAIAAIAREHGEDLADPAVGLACLEVFGLGHSGPAAAETESGYFAIRALFAQGLAQAADVVVNKGSLHGGSALALRALAPLVNRFSAVVTQKLAAQAVAVVGAVGGAAINLAFVEHFQEVARGHFAVRRLERIYGAEPVRTEYDRLRAADQQQRAQIPAMS